MKIIKHIPLTMLVFLYTMASSNFFLNYIPVPPMAGNMAIYFELMISTKYMLVVKILEVLLVVGMLVPKTRALSLVMIAPISVNILLFELLIAQQPATGILLVIMNAIAIYQRKEKYRGILV